MMSYVPVVTEDQDALQYGTPTLPVPDASDVFKSEIDNTLLRLPFPTGMFHLTNLMNHKYGIGEFMQPDQIKDKYPNVSFPGGEYESVVKQTSDEKSILDFNNQVLENAPSNFFNTTSKASSWLLGNLLSPTGILLGAATGSLFNMAGSAVMSRMAESSTISRVAARAALGVAESAIITTPYSLADYRLTKDIQEPYDPLSAIENFGIGALLVGTLRTAFGFKTPVDSDANNAALSAAKDQILNGNKVDIGPIITGSLIRNIKNDGVQAEDIAQSLSDIADLKSAIQEKTKQDFLNSFSELGINKTVDPAILSDMYDIASSSDNKEEFLKNVSTSSYKGLDEGLLSEIYDAQKNQESPSLNPVEIEKILYEKNKQNFLSNNIKSIGKSIKSNLLPKIYDKAFKSTSREDFFKRLSRSNIKDYVMDAQGELVNPKEKLYRSQRPGSTDLIDKRGKLIDATQRPYRYFLNESKIKKNKILSEIYNNVSTISDNLSKIDYRTSKPEDLGISNEDISNFNKSQRIQDKPITFQKDLMHERFLKVIENLKLTRVIKPELLSSIYDLSESSVTKQNFLEQVQRYGIFRGLNPELLSKMYDAVSNVRSFIERNKNIEDYLKTRSAGQEEVDAFKDALISSSKEDFLERASKNGLYKNLSDELLSEIYDSANSVRDMFSEGKPDSSINIKKADTDDRSSNFISDKTYGRSIKDLKQIEDDTNEYINIKNSYLKDISNRDLIDKINDINSWKGKATTNITDHMETERNKEELENESFDSSSMDKKIKEYEDEMNDLINDSETEPEVSQEYKNVMDELDSESDKDNKINDALKNVIKCLIGN